jgi:hypothetical protein
MLPPARTEAHLARVTGTHPVRQSLSAGESLVFRTLPLRMRVTSKTLLALDPRNVTSMNNLGIADLHRMSSGSPFFRHSLATKLDLPQHWPQKLLSLPD